MLYIFHYSYRSGPLRRLAFCDILTLFNKHILGHRISCEKSQNGDPWVDNCYATDRNYWNVLRIFLIKKADNIISVTKYGAQNCL